MDLLTSFAVISAIIIIGYFAELLFKRTGIPDVLVLIGIGILLKHYFEAVNPGSFGSGITLFTTFTLIYLLFQGALAIDFKTLFNSVKEATLVTIISFTFTVIITTILSIVLFDFSIYLALLFGVIIGGTSSAVVIPLVKMLPINKKHGSTLMLESAMSDVLCIVGAMTIINVIISGNVSGATVFKDVISSFALALVVGGIMGLLWIFTLFRFKDLRRAHLVTIAMVIALYVFVESPFVEASGAISALAFGLILGNSRTILSLSRKKEEESHSEIINVLSKSAQSFFSEISFFVKVFFFVYLGILMDFSSPILFAVAAIFVFSIYMLRPLTIKLVYGKQNIDDYSRTVLETLIPKGLAAAVLVNITIQAGVPGAEVLVGPILSIILISIVLTSILVPLANKGFFKGFTRIFYKKQNNFEKKDDSKKLDSSKKLSLKNQNINKDINNNINNKDDSNSLDEIYNKF